MSRVLHRQLATVPPRAVSASGMHIVDDSGRRYLDACGGAAVSCLGHGHPDVLAAMHAQIDQLAYAHTSFFTSEVSEALAVHGFTTTPGLGDRPRGLQGLEIAIDAIDIPKVRPFWQVVTG